MLAAIVFLAVRKAAGGGQSACHISIDKLAGLFLGLYRRED